MAAPTNTALVKKVTCQLGFCRPHMALSGPRSASGVCPQSEQKRKSNLSDHSVRSLAIWDAESVFRLADASELAS